MAGQIVYESGLSVKKGLGFSCKSLLKPLKSLKTCDSNYIQILQ